MQTHGRRYRSCALGVLLALIAGTAHGADDVAARRPGVLYLRTGSVQTLARPNALDAPRFDRGARYVITLDGPMTPQRREALGRAGVRLGAYLPLYAFVANLDDATPMGLRELGFVTWAGVYDPAWRIDPALRVRGRVWEDPWRQELEASGRVLVRVRLFGGAPDGPTLRAITAMDRAEVREAEQVGGAWTLVTVLPLARLDELAAMTDVQFVEEQPEYTLRSNATTRWVVQSNVQDVTPLYTHGLTGVGQIVGIIDGRIGVGHCAFVDSVNPIGPDHRKIHAYNTWLGYNFHGTHVAGTAVGDAGDWGNARGVAFGARLVYNTYPQATETSVFERFDLHASQGARVHSNSWGSDFNWTYDGACRAIDTIQHDQEDNLIVHSVSNSNRVTNPENAKNSLAVAATSQPPNQENWCIGGAGPTEDGRRKPEIMAPGCGIVSSSGSTGCATSASTGTSMATPAVSGVAALVRQYYMEGFYPTGTRTPSDEFIPTGQLIKATLVNSAMDMTGVAGFPNVTEGWGRVLADNALYFAGDSTSLVVRDLRNSAPDALETGDSRSFGVSPQSGQSLKVTLCWADVAGEDNAEFAAVNNLDLVVISPGGVTYRGNVFANGYSAPGGDADQANNLEQVLVTAPEPGVWEVRVEGAGVNVGRQGFALVITGAPEVPACDPDFNGDGSADQGDVACMILALAGDTSCAAHDADFNADGSADQADLAAIIEVVAGGPCP